MMKKIRKIMKDMLTEFSEKENKVKTSQSRVYLLISVIAYYTALGTLLIAGVGKNHTTIEMDNFEVIIEALKYAMLLFAGYTFGGKFLNVINVIGGAKGVKPPEDSGKQMLND